MFLEAIKGVFGFLMRAAEDKAIETEAEVTVHVRQLKRPIHVSQAD
jgi:hypothetical protein